MSRSQTAARQARKRLHQTPSLRPLEQGSNEGTLCPPECLHPMTINTLLPLLPAVTLLGSEEPRAPFLALVGEAYLVGKRKPLSSLPPEKQEQIRQSYADTDWAVSDLDNDVEFLGIATTLEAAERKKKSLEGGFWVKLPVNGWLNEKEGRYTIQSHNSAEQFYEETSPGLLTTLLQVDQQMQRLHKLAS